MIVPGHPPLQNPLFAHEVDTNFRRTTQHTHNEHNLRVSCLAAGRALGLAEMQTYAPNLIMHIGANYDSGPNLEFEVDLIDYTAVVIPQNQGLGNTLFSQTGGDIRVRYASFEDDRQPGAAGLSGAPNRCVLDCLLERFQDVAFFSSMTAEKLCAMFKEQAKEEDEGVFDINNGISLKHLTRVLKVYFPQVSLYAIDPTMKVVWSHLAAEPRVNLTVFVNESTRHVTLIRDTSLRRSAALTRPGALCVDILKRDAELWRSVKAKICDMREIDMDNYSGNIDGLAEVICASGPGSPPGWLLVSTSGSCPDISELICNVSRRQKAFVEHISHTSGTSLFAPPIRSFIVPLTNKPVVVRHDYADVRALVDFLAEDGPRLALGLPQSMCTYSGQSRCALGNSLMLHLIGKYRSSQFNSTVASMFESQRGGVASQVWGEHTKEGTFGVDICRAYTSILLDPPFGEGVGWPVFGVFSDFVPYVQRTAIVGNAFYFVRPGSIRPLPFAPKFQFARTLLPGFYISYLQSHGVLSATDITHVLMPESVLPSDVFANATTQLLDVFGTDDARERGMTGACKIMINGFIGMRALLYNNRVRSVLTDSNDYCAQLHGRAVETGEIPIVVKTKQSLSSDGGAADHLYHVQLIDRKLSFENDLPIYQSIIHATTMRLLEVMRVMHEGGYQAVGMETDAAVFQISGSPVDTEPKTEFKDWICGPGENVKMTLGDRMGETPGKLRMCDTRERQISAIDYTAYARELHRECERFLSAPAKQRAEQLSPTICATVEDIERNKDVLLKNGMLVTGGPGHGKSWLLSKLVALCRQPQSDNHRDRDPQRSPPKFKVAVFTPTGAARDALPRDLGCKTIDWLITKCGNSIARTAAELATYTHVFIDEFSQAQPLHWEVLRSAKNRNSKLRFFIFGDSDQQLPYEGLTPTTQQHVVDTSELVQTQLCDSRRLDLPYVEGCSRYDLRLRIAVDAMRVDGVWRLACQGVRQELEENIVPSNYLKRVIDKRHMDRVADACAEEDPNMVFNWRHTSKSPAAQHWRACPGLKVIVRQNCSSANGTKLSNSARYIVTELNHNQVQLKRLREYVAPPDVKIDIDDDDEFEPQQLDGYHSDVSLRLQPQPTPVPDSEPEPDAADVDRDPDGDDVDDHDNVLVNKSIFCTCFELDYATTSQRIQSRTIREPYNIWDPQQMTKRGLYVALSRGTKGSDVRVAPSHHLATKMWDDPPLRKTVFTRTPKHIFASIFALTSPDSDTTVLCGEVITQETALNGFSPVDWLSDSVIESKEYEAALAADHPWAVWVANRVEEAEARNGATLADLIQVTPMEDATKFATKWDMICALNHQALMMHRSGQKFVMKHNGKGPVVDAVERMMTAYDAMIAPVPAPAPAPGPAPAPAPKPASVVTGDLRHLPRFKYERRVIKSKRQKVDIYGILFYNEMVEGKWRRVQYSQKSNLTSPKLGRHLVVSVEDRIAGDIKECIAAKYYAVAPGKTTACVQANLKKFRDYRDNNINA